MFIFCLLFQQQIFGKLRLLVEGILVVLSLNYNKKIFSLMYLLVKRYTLNSGALYVTPYLS